MIILDYMNKKIVTILILIFSIMIVVCFCNSLSFKLYKLTFNKPAKIGIAVLKDNKIYLNDHLDCVQIR